jgi:XTP/dITP diphosphohydrolase
VSPRRLLVATTNPGKLREIRALLGDLPFDVCSLEGLPAVDFPEEGGDYEANAIGKARAVADQLGVLAVADDSGLEVDALDGHPGVYSARYGGGALDDRGRLKRLLGEMADRARDVGRSERTARFVCVAALATPEGRSVARRGECPGAILEAPRGDAGFGYDPVFVPEGYDEAMAELDAGEKDRISHRGRAFVALRASLLEEARR